RVGRGGLVVDRREPESVGAVGRPHPVGLDPVAPLMFEGTGIVGVREVRHAILCVHQRAAPAARMSRTMPTPVNPAVSSWVTVSKPTSRPIWEYTLLSWPPVSAVKVLPF